MLVRADTRGQRTPAASDGVPYVQWIKQRFIHGAGEVLDYADRRPHVQITGQSGGSTASCSIAGG